MRSYDGDGAFTADELHGAHDAQDPFAWFQASFERAKSLESFDATRAALATVSASGQPSVRFVLVKQVDAAGFVFFTNFESRKASELDATPRAALAFHWASIGEQVRVEGTVTRASAEESDAYFASRARGSQLGAWASQQSRPIETRSQLETKLAAVTERFRAAQQVPRPEHWGGFRIVPSAIEFWRDRRDRLHDRIAFTRDGQRWRSARLQP